jgi:hypothetical protein
VSFGGELGDAALSASNPPRPIREKVLRSLYNPGLDKNMITALLKTMIVFASTN